MQSDVLQKLREEKMATIINELVLGVNVRTIARTIQEEWGEAQGVSRAALEKELTSLRESINQGGLTHNWPVPSRPNANSDHLQIGALDDFSRLVALHAKRVEELSKRERVQGKYLPALTSAIKVYGNMLNTLQNMRFDMGMDVYKRVKLTPYEWRAAQESNNYLVQKQVAEAVDVLEEALKRREKPPVADHQC
jgi:hypothetical protein